MRQAKGIMHTFDLATQWKIGPANEASIANVMLHASPGFICLVDTPTMGFAVYRRDSPMAPSEVASGRFANLRVLRIDANIRSAGFCGRVGLRK